MNCEALACRLSLVLLTLAAVPAAAEPAPLPISFDHVSFADGLANSSVSMITQDDRGFLWFGTQAGLQRYDGYGMDLFTAEPFDRNSLSNQLVQTMYLGPDNDMWIGTYGGLNKLDIDTEQVTRFPHGDAAPYALSNSVVTSIDHDAEGNLWVATLDGLNRLDSEEDKRFTVFPADPEDQTRLPDDTVRAVFTDSRGDLWVGTHGGLSRLVSTGNDRSVSFETWGVVETDQAGQRDHGLVSPYVMAITEDGSGNLWIGSWDGGLSRFDATTEQFKHYDLPDNRVYAVMVTTEGLVYSATWGGGLYILDPETGAINEYRHDPDVSGSLAHDVVYSLFQDKSGIVCKRSTNPYLRMRAAAVSFRPEVPYEQHRTLRALEETG